MPDQDNPSAAAAIAGNTKKKRKATLTARPKAAKKTKSKQLPSLADKGDGEPKTAAARFIAISELCRYFFRFHDRTSLTRFARLEKGLMHDVASVLYATVDLYHMRFKMSRSPAWRKINCDAVRTVRIDKTFSALDDSRWTTDWEALGQDAAKLKYDEKTMLAAVPFVLKKCPGAFRVTCDHKTYIGFDRQGQTTGIMAPQTLRCPINTDDQRSESDVPFPGIQGLPRLFTSVQIRLRKTVSASELEVMEIAAPIESIESRGALWRGEDLVDCLRYLDHRVSNGSLAAVRKFCCTDVAVHLHIFRDLGALFNPSRLDTLELRLPDIPSAAHWSIADLPGIFDLIVTALTALRNLDIALRWVNPAQLSADVWRFPHIHRAHQALKTFKLRLETLPAPKDGIFNCLLFIASVVDKPCRVSVHSFARLDGRGIDVARRRGEDYREAVQKMIKLRAAKPCLYRLLAGCNLFDLGISRAQGLDSADIGPDGKPMHVRLNLATRVRDALLAHKALDETISDALAAIADARRTAASLRAACETLKRRMVRGFVCYEVLAWPYDHIPEAMALVDHVMYADLGD